MKWIVLAIFFLAVAARAGPSCDPYQLASHWAPLIHQGAATSQDFLTRVDYDGNWIGNDNWEHLAQGDLRAYVYYSLIETRTHFFLFYSLFHPRDYEPLCLPLLCHENDMESLELVVLKDGSPFGRLQAMETLAHSHIYLYWADPEVRGGRLRPRGPMLLSDGHPVVYVETYGHGIHGEPLRFKHGEIIYSPGEEAQRPASLDDQVHYKLVPIYSTLWARRDLTGDGLLFDSPFDYRGITLPGAFDGDDYGADRANPPWGYGQETGDSVVRGDWFLDPARALAYHAHFPDPYSREYAFNPYLADLGLLGGSGP